jgi:hypothetical protein
MQRDMDLARRILQEIEKAPFDGGTVELNLPDLASETLQYHLLLLSEAGLIHALDASSMAGPAFLPTRLTWQGHEFLDASRSESLWNRAKSIVLTKTGGMAFDLLFYVLKEYAKQLVLGGLGAA